MSRIQDILASSKSRRINSMFNSYKPIEEIGKKMFDSFRTLFVPDKGFPIERNANAKIGTISNCMALSTFLEFISMGVDISESNEEFLFVLKSVFDSVYRNDGRIVFDAKPYITYDDNTNLSTYVETISKVLIVMIDLRNYAIKSDLNKKSFMGSVVLANEKVDSFAGLAKCANRLLLDSMHMLCESCLIVEPALVKPYKISGVEVVRSGFDSHIKYRGWAFCKPEADSNKFDTSLYYTYHATNAFISLYNAYTDIFENVFAGKEYDESYLSKLSQLDREKHIIDESFIKDNSEIIKMFRQMTCSSGRYIDSILSERGINMSFDYIQSGIRKVSTERVMESQKNNCVINTLMVLAILINAGIDEDYIQVGKGDYYYNQLQYTLTNIKKIYNLYNQENKADLIDSYRLPPLFADEKYPDRCSGLAQKFRSECESLVVYDLIPLMCNTYYIMFNFLINYPQREMVDNLELILDKRSDGDNWFWDKKFNINNNLYYILGIENFYEYYSNYELPLTKNEEKYNLVAQKAREDLSVKQRECDELKLQLSEKDRLYKEKQSELDAAVKELAKDTFNNIFELNLEKYFKDAFAELSDFSINARYSMNSDAQVSEILNKYPKAQMLVKIADSLNIPKVIQKKDTSRTDIDSVIKNAVEEDVVLRICRRSKIDD